MKIVALVKQVPDPNAVRLDPRGGDILSGAPLVPNEYDLAAVEAAIRLSETLGDVEVVVGGFGNVKDALNRCLAMGAHRAVAIEAPSGTKPDTMVTATVLTAWLRAEGFDLIVTGQEASDGGTGNVPPQLAAMLGLPVVSNVIGLEYDGGTLRLKREIEDGHQTVTVEPPAVLSALTALNEPRYPSLKGIMAARRKPYETRSLADLGLSAEQLQSLVSWGSLFAEEQVAAGIIIEDESAAEAVDKLLAFLDEHSLI